jgi:hypothetical protein
MLLSILKDYLLIKNTHYTDASIKDPSVSMTIITVYKGTHAGPVEMQEARIAVWSCHAPKKYCGGFNRMMAGRVI